MSRGGTKLFSGRDITARKEAESQLVFIQGELRQQADLFRNTFEQAAVGIAHVSPQGEFIRLNQRFCEIAGYPCDELQTLTFQDITHPDDLQADLDYVNEMLADQRQTYSLEKRYIGKNGAINWVNLTVSLVRDAEGEPNYFIAVIEDIGDRKQAELRLKEMNNALNAAAVVATTDPEGRITFLNERFCQLSGYSATELLGKTFRTINADYHPDSFFRTLWQTITAGQIWRGEICNRAKNGSLYWVDTTIVPCLDNQGVPHQYLAIRFDITDRKRAEVQLITESQERQQALDNLKITSDRLQESNQELQDFAYVASHDLQEPLRKIQAFGDRLNTTSQDELNDKGKDYLARMLNAANRAQTLIQDLLTFSRVTTKAQPFTPVNLETILQEVLSDLEISLLTYAT